GPPGRGGPLPRSAAAYARRAPAPRAFLRESRRDDRRRRRLAQPRAMLRYLEDLPGIDEVRVGDAVQLDDGVHRRAETAGDGVERVARLYGVGATAAGDRRRAAGGGRDGRRRRCPGPPRTP